MAGGFKKYDFYRKAIDGLQTKTSVGGLGTTFNQTITHSITRLRNHHRRSNMSPSHGLSHYQDFDHADCAGEIGRRHTHPVDYPIRPNAMRKYELQNQHQL